MAGETTARGLGWPHRQRRGALLRMHIDGSLCWWCGLPMFKRQGLAADHSRPRARGGRQADRLLHGPCNSARGDGSRDNDRPALRRAAQSVAIRPTREW